MYKKLLILIIAIINFLISVSAVLAIDSFKEDSGLDAIANPAGYGTLLTPTYLAGYYIGIILSFVGVIFLGLMIYAGYTWMMAQGVQSEVAKAKTLIKQAVIGLLIVVLAYTITMFVAGSVAGDDCVVQAVKSGIDPATACVGK